MIHVLLVDDQNLIREGLKALLEQEPDLEVVGDADTGKSAIQQVETLKPDVVLIDLCVPRIDGIATTQTICERFPETQVLVLTTLDDDESVANALKVGATGYLLKDVSPDELVGAIRNVHKGYTQLSPGLLPKILSRVNTGIESAEASPRSASADISSRSASADISSRLASADISLRSASADISSRSTPTNKVLTFNPGQRRSFSASRSDSTLPPGFTKLTTRERQVLRLIAAGSSNREISQSLAISEGTVKNHVASILGRLNLRDRTQAAIIANSVMPLLS
jgi:DNA-binding NarL/FixJ family response regulator